MVNCCYCGDECYKGELDVDFAELFMVDIEAIRFGMTPHRWFSIWLEMAQEIGTAPTDQMLRYNIVERMLSYLLYNYKPTFCLRLATLLYHKAEWSEIQPRLKNPSHYYTVLLLMYSAMGTDDDLWSQVDESHKLAVKLHHIHCMTGGAIKIEFG